MESQDEIKPRFPRDPEILAQLSKAQAELVKGTEAYKDLIKKRNASLLAAEKNGHTDKDMAAAMVLTKGRISQLLKKLAPDSQRDK